MEELGVVNSALRVLRGVSRATTAQGRGGCKERAAHMLVDALQAELEQWQKWFGWDPDAYMFVDLDQVPDRVRITVGVPHDPWATRLRRVPALPQPWPALNTGLTHTEGFSLSVEACGSTRVEDLTVSVRASGSGMRWIRDAMLHPQADKIGRVIQQGRFGLSRPGTVGEQPKKSCFEALKRAVGEAEIGEDEWAFDRSFHGLIEDLRVREAMQDAMKLINTLTLCWAMVAKARHEGKAVGELIN